MIIATLIALTLAQPPPGKHLPDSGFAAPFEVALNPGPGGRFSSAGCMELEIRLGNGGFAEKVRIVQSSKYYQIDRAVLNALTSYRFKADGLPRDVAWTAFFSWSADGRRTAFSSKCVVLD